jgi:small-conductance mechanosensitive channel
MRPSILTDPHLLLKSLLGLLTCVVLAAIVSNYPRYLPPDFTSDFLYGRADSFFGTYRWAFYAHLAAGPVALVLGLTLLSDRLRRRHPAWHRVLGRIEMAVVLLLLAPSGLWMSASAATGTVAGLGFATLALATAATASLGWRAAVGRRFAAHGIWMTRLFALLSSAVVLRLTSGLAILADLDADWLYPASAWASWLLPLAACEAWRVTRRV